MLDVKKLGIDHDQFDVLRNPKNTNVETPTHKTELSRTHIIMCSYKGKPRRVHSEVCRWHREEQDPECAGCHQVTKKS